MSKVKYKNNKYIEKVRIIFARISLYFANLRFFTSLPLHLKATKIKWYKKWHQNKHYRAVHVAVLLAYIFSLVSSLFVAPSQSYASLVQKNKTITSEADFGSGTFNNTNSTNNNGGEVELSGFSALSNNGGGVWKYKRPVTVNNTSNANNLSDYQVNFTQYGVTENGNYSFNDGTAVDASGNGNNGVLNGGITTATGKFGLGMDFDGVDDYIDMGNKPQFQNTLSQSISMWLKPTDFATRRNPYGKAYGGEGTMSLETNGTINYYFGANGGEGNPYQSFNTVTPLTAGSWNHIVVVRDLASGRVRWYLNNVKIQDIVITQSSIKTSLNSFTLGTGYLQPARYKGGMDEVRVFSGALSDTDVASLYNTNTVTIDNGSIFDKTNVDGSDLRFTDSNGATELPYFIEKYDKGLRQLKVKIKVPNIAGSTNKNIYVYYGNSLATNSSNTTALTREISGLASSLTGDSSTWDQVSNIKSADYTYYRNTIFNGDSTTSWTGTSLSTDTVDKQEGTAALVDTVATPVATTNYITTYNPAGTWYWPNADTIYLPIKSDRANTAFTSARFYLYDTSNNWRYWNLVFAAGTWTNIAIGTGSGYTQSATAPNFSAIDYARFEFIAADTTAFYKKIDFSEIKLRNSGGEYYSAGKQSYTYNLDGKDDYYDIPDSNALHLTSAWTVEAWVNSRATVPGGSDIQMIFSKWGNSSALNIDYSLQINSSGKIRAMVSPGTGAGPVTSIIGGTVLSSNTWYHVAATFNNTELKVYLNGQLDGTVATGFSAYSNNNPLRIGAFDFTWTAYKHNFNGFIDEPRVFNRDLSQAELNDIANGYAFVNPFSTNKLLVKKLSSPDPTTSINSEIVASSLTGTYLTSSDPANAIDLFWHGGWGAGISNFNANVVVPSGNIGFEARTSDVGGADSNWTAWSDLGQATTTGLFETNSGSDPVDVLQRQRYLQLRVTINSGGTTSPILKDFSIIYLSDENPPNNPSSIFAFADNTKNLTLLDASWSNSSSPYFEWDEPTEATGESGVNGYWVYFGTDSTADPKTAGEFRYTPNYQANLSDGDSGKTYYLAISTEDVAGNRVTEVAPNYYKRFTYKFDKTSPNVPSSITVNPVGWTTINKFNFSWQDAFDQTVNGGASGIRGYQYKRGGGGDVWYPPIEFPLAGLTVDNITSYQNGQNNFYIRSVDNAGNVSQEVKVNYYYNADAPSKPTSLSVSPQSSTENSFNFSWDLPASYNNQIKGYYYSINTEPNQNNSKFIPLNLAGLTETGAIPAALQQGFNRFYVVAIDSNDNINWANFENIMFECNTSAPGFPTGVEIFDTSNRDLAKYSIAVNWTEPTSKGPGFAGYIIERSTDQINYSEIGRSAGVSYIDTGLQSQNYYYRVNSYDNSGNISVPSEIVSIKPTGKYTSAPKITVQPETTVKVSTADVRFVTDREASSFVEIGESVEYGLTQGQFEFVTDHKVRIDRLKPDTIYHYRVKYIDVDGNIGYSSDILFKTLPAPRVMNLNVDEIRLNSAVVTWNTTAPAQASIRYGKSANYGQTITNISGGFTTNHSVKLTGLDHSSSYHLAIVIKDYDSNEVISDDYAFDTLTYPKLSNIRFEQQKNTASSTMKVTWVSNVPTTSIVEYKGAKDLTAKEYSKSALDLNHSVLISNLVDNSDYVILVKGRDAYGNEAKSDANRVRTDYDTRPPVISGVAVETSIVGFGADAKGQIAVSWETDEISTSQVEYGIGVSGDNYSQKSLLDTALTTSHVVIISGLKPSSSYHIRVLSKDTSGNEGISEDNPVLTEQASSSVLDVIISSLQKSIGWLFGGLRR